MRTRGVLGALSICALLAQPTQAGIEGYIRIGSGSETPLWTTPVAAGVPISINVGTVDADDVQVRFFSNASPPTETIGRITISGSTTGGDGRLKILIADTGVAEFPVSTLLPIDPGCGNFAGIAFTDDNLRNDSILAAAFSGDLADSINVGHVFRLQADGITQPNGTISGGNIDARVQAWAPDVADTSSEPPNIFERAIQYIRAGNRISGNIIAGDADPSVTADPLTPSTLGTVAASIDKIRVGPAVTSEGITGHIIARRGAIGTILTTGKLGTSALALAKIEAGRGIDEIRAVQEGDNVPVVNTAVGNNFFVRVRNGLTPTTTINAPFQDILNLLETSGNLVGTIRVRNMNGEVSPPNQIAGHAGIIAGGYIDADITVEQVVNYANIFGTSLRKPVIIGKQLKGAVVAYGTPATSSDPLAGTIDQIRVASSPMPTMHTPHSPEGWSG